MLRELVLDVARQRLQLLRLLDHLRHLGELADEVRLVLDPALEPDPAHALDEDPQRAVGDPDQLVDDRGGADLVQVVPAGRLDVLVPHGDEGDHPVARGDVVDELDRALLADRERRHRLREDDRLLQRQHRERRGDLDLLAVDRGPLARARSPLLLALAEDDQDPAGARLARQRHHDSSAGRARSAPRRRRGRHPRPARSGAGTGRTRSPSAGTRRGPRGAGAAASPAMLTVRSATVISTSSGSIPARSTTTVTAGGSSVRKQSTCGPVAAPARGEARQLPQLGEQLFDLLRN